MQRKRDPREPTPLVLMNPELRVRQLRYAANIEATQMVPLYRYYEVLLDLSLMGLEYLKAMKLERAFIIFKRIEYFIFHRLKEHPGADTFQSDAKHKMLGRMPIIMYVAQQIIVDFVMPVYERQAAYFRYEELQRRLSIVNPTAWSAIMAEAARREAEFYSEAERISTRFGVELASFLPREVAPDDHHPSNFPPRTFPAKSTPTETGPSTALTQAIASLNQTFPISADQSIESLVANINSMMNNALVDFFNARVRPDVQYPLNMTLPQQTTTMQARSTSSPRVTHMYSMPVELASSSSAPQATSTRSSEQQFEYAPTYSLDTYVDLLQRTYDGKPTGFRVCQRVLKTSTAGFQLYLERKEDGPPTTSLAPEPDPGAPRATPPTVPLTTVPQESADSKSWGVWEKRAADVGSLGVLSHLDSARETLDRVPPLPDGGIRHVGGTLTEEEEDEEDEEDEIDVVGEGQRKRRSTTNLGGGSGAKKANN